MATAGFLTCVLKLTASGLPEKMSVTIVLAISALYKKRRKKTLTAAGLSGLLTRFPFNHYAHFL